MIGGDIHLLEKINRKLIDQFKMTDMGDVSLVLSMQVTRDRQGKTMTFMLWNVDASISCIRSQCSVALLVDHTPWL